VAQGKYPEALELARNAKDIYTAALSADHWRTAIAESAEGAALTGLGRYPEAETRLTHGHAILSKEGGLPLVYRALAQRYLDTLHRRERLAGAGAAHSPATGAAHTPATLAVRTKAQISAARSPDAP
jgi:hypothetical protein